MPPRLYRAIIPVVDIERGAAFYAHILDMPGERVAPSRHYFDCGGVILAVVQPTHEGDRPIAAEEFSPNMQHFYLAVDDLEAALARARAAEGGEVTSEIELQPWGERSFYLRDPFGNPLCFVEEGTLFTGGFVE